MSEERWDYQEPVEQESVALPLVMVGVIVVGLVILIGSALLLVG